MAGAALFAAAVVLPLVRQAAVPWDSLWAEDGRLYVQDANTMPLHATLFRGYAGYGQLLGRLLAMPTRYVPVGLIPPYMALAGTTTAALLALFVYRAADTHIPAVPARLALAGACVLVPVLALENEATVVNVTWVLTFATFWALVSWSSGPFEVAARALVAFLAPATCPIAALFLPLLVAVLWSRRNRADALVGGAFLTGVLLQAAMVLTTDTSVPTMPSTVRQLAVLYPVRVLASGLVGERALRELWPLWGVWLGVGAVVLTVGLAAVGLRHAGTTRCRTAVAALVLSVPLFAVPVFLRGTFGMQLATDVYNANGARYAVVPVLLLVSAAAVLTAQASRRWIAGVLAAQVLVVGLTSFGHVEEWRPRGPSWTEGIHQAQLSCHQSSDPDRNIPIAPVGWFTRLPCTRLAP